MWGGLGDDLARWARGLLPSPSGWAGGACAGEWRRAPPGALDVLDAALAQRQQGLDPNKRGAAGRGAGIRGVAV